MVDDDASPQGTVHKPPPKHPNRDIQDVAARHNRRDEDTTASMAVIASGMDGKRLRYRDLTADNGLSVGAHS